MPFSRQQKLEIINKLTDENFLRTDILIPLFRNMEKFEQVLDNHGPNEKGTDIILVEKTIFGGYRYTSVVLKAQHITNATNIKKDRETAANVSQQIALAINSGHNCNLAKRKVDYNAIIVITSQTISNTARESLIDGVKMFRFSDITFLEGEDLLTMIDVYLPKFYYYQSGIQARVAAALQSKCERLSDLQNLPQFTVEDRALLDVFVKPLLQRIHSHRIDGKTKNQIVIKTPDQIISEHDRILIIGEPGSGKSILMREAVLQLLAANSHDTRPRLPLLVKAHDLSKSGHTHFVGALEEVIQRYYNLPDFEFDFIRRDADITLLIDGLDEIADLEAREQLKRAIIEFYDTYQGIRIVLTTRRTQDITDINNMISFQHWEILPFNFPQVREFIGKWFSNCEESNQRLLAALENHELLSRLPNTPLVLTLLAILFDSDNSREIPSNLAELYQMFLDLLLGKWNLDRRVDTMHRANIREYLATEIAQIMHGSNLLSVSQDMFTDIVKKAGEKRGIDVDPSELLSDFTEQTALLVFNDRYELEFRHLSFQEFLVALALYKRPVNDGIELLIQNFEQSWWTKVLYFYCGLRQDAPDVLTRVTSRLSSLDLPQQMVGVLELGYLVQAAYLTPINIRMETVDVALRRFYACINSLHDLRIGEQKIPEGMVYIAFMFWLSMHFSSRMLQKFYRELFNQLMVKPDETAESSFVMLSLAIFMADNKDFRALSEVHAVVKVDDRQLLTLSILGEYFVANLSSQDKHKVDVDELKSNLNQIRKWFRNHPNVAKELMHTSTTSLMEKRNRSD